MLKKIIITLVLSFVCVFGFNISSEAEEQTRESNIPDSAILTKVEDLGDGCYLYEYTDVGICSIGAKQAHKYFAVEIAGQTAIEVKCMVSFSYGHDDGIVRVINPTYQVIQVDPGWNVALGAITTSTQNGEIGKGIFNITYYHDGQKKPRQLVIYCKNNGGFY